MPNTPIYGLPYPSLGDPPDGPDQIGALAEAVETELVRIDDDVNDLENVPVAQSASDAASVSTTSVTYVALTGDPGVAFVAPTSGRVIISFGATLDGNTTTVFAMIAVQVRSGSTIGSGTIFYAVNDNDGVGHEGSTAAQGGRSIMVSGLTPGSSYNAQVLYKLFSGSGTAFFARRNVIVAPTS